MNGSIYRQVSTHRDQCNQVGSIYRDAHVLELDIRACIKRWTDIVLTHTPPVQYSTVPYSTVQYGSINMQVSTHRDQCTLVGSIYRDAYVLELDNRAWTSTVEYSTIQYSTVQHSTALYSTVHYSTVQYSTVRIYLHASKYTQRSVHSSWKHMHSECRKKIKIIILTRRVVRTINFHNKKQVRTHTHVQYSTVQYSTVQYGSINMQVSTHRDQCTLVRSIYRDAHVLELDNRAWIGTVQYSTVQYSAVQYKHYHCTIEK